VTTAQQDISLFALVLWQCKGGVFLHLYIAIKEERLAG